MLPNPEAMALRYTENSSFSQIAKFVGNAKDYIFTSYSKLFTFGNNEIRCESQKPLSLLFTQSPHFHN